MKQTLIQRWDAIHHRLIDVQEEFLHDQIRLHEQFLATQNRAQQALAAHPPRTDEDPPEPQPLGEQTHRFTLDPNKHPWLADHCPTWTVATVPLMVVLDQLTSLARRPVIRIENLRISGWIVVDRPRTFCVTYKKGKATLSMERDDAAPKEVAFATIIEGIPGEAFPPPPAPWTPVHGEALSYSIYEQAHTFHGPTYHLLESLVFSDKGASATINLDKQRERFGRLNPILLDVSSHAIFIPYHMRRQWTLLAPVHARAFPARLLSLQIFGPTPWAGMLRCEMRFDGFFSKPFFPQFQVQVIHEDRVWAQYLLVEACFPVPEHLPQDQRRIKAFMRDRCYDESLLFSSFKAGCTRLSLRGLQRVKWLPAEHFEFFYGSENARVIAEREHCARLLRVNPSFPIDQVLPFHRVALSVAEEKEEIVVTQKEAGQLILPLLQKRLREQQVGKEEIDEICSDAQARLTSFIVEHPLALMNSTRSLLFVVEHATPQDLLLTWGCLVAWQQRSILLIEKGPAHEICGLAKSNAVLLGGDVDASTSTGGTFFEKWMHVSVRLSAENPLRLDLASAGPEAKPMVSIRVARPGSSENTLL